MAPLHDPDLGDGGARCPGRATPPAPAVADGRGDGRRRTVVVAVGVVAALAMALLAVRTWSGDVEVPVSVTSSIPTAAGRSEVEPAAARPGVGARWALLGSGGARDVEHYDDLAGLFAAAPLLVRGAVARVELGPVTDDGQADEPRRDLLLTLAPARTAGPAADDVAEIVVQLGPLFGDEAAQAVAQLSSGPGSVIGDESVWALRPRADGPTYRPLTSASTFVRDRGAVVVATAAEADLAGDPALASWARLVAAAGLG